MARMTTCTTLKRILASSRQHGVDHVRRDVVERGLHHRDDARNLQSPPREAGRARLRGEHAARPPPSPSSVKYCLKLARVCGAQDQRVVRDRTRAVGRLGDAQLASPHRASDLKEQYLVVVARLGSRTGTSPVKLVADGVATVVPAEGHPGDRVVRRRYLQSDAPQTPA